MWTLPLLFATDDVLLTDLELQRHATLPVIARVSDDDDLMALLGADPTDLDPRDAGEEEVDLEGGFDLERWRLARQAHLHGTGMSALGPLAVTLGVGLAALGADLRFGAKRSEVNFGMGLFTVGYLTGVAGGVAFVVGFPMMISGAISENLALSGRPRTRSAGQAAAWMLGISGFSLLLAPFWYQAAGMLLAVSVGTFYIGLAMESRQIVLNRQAAIGDDPPPTQPFAWTVVPTGNGVAFIAGF